MGRHKGSKNKVGHQAGGARQGAGRPRVSNSSDIKGEAGNIASHLPVNCPFAVCVRRFPSKGPGLRNHIIISHAGTREHVLNQLAEEILTEASEQFATLRVSLEATSSGNPSELPDSSEALEDELGNEKLFLGDGTPTGRVTGPPITLDPLGNNDGSGSNSVAAMDENGYLLDPHSFPTNVNQEMILALQSMNPANHELARIQASLMAGENTGGISEDVMNLLQASASGSGSKDHGQHPDSVLHHDHVQHHHHHSRAHSQSNGEDGEVEGSQSMSVVDPSLVDDVNDQRSMDPSLSDNSTDQRQTPSSQDRLLVSAMQSNAQDRAAHSRASPSFDPLSSLSNHRTHSPSPGPSHSRRTMTPASLAAQFLKKKPYARSSTPTQSPRGPRNCRRCLGFGDKEGALSCPGRYVRANCNLEKRVHTLSSQGNAEWDPSVPSAPSPSHLQLSEPAEPSVINLSEAGSSSQPFGPYPSHPTHSPIPSLPSIPTLPAILPPTAGKDRQRRHCRVCQFNGGDGLLCPGRGDRKKCRFYKEGEISGLMVDAGLHQHVHLVDNDDDRQGMDSSMDDHHAQQDSPDDRRRQRSANGHPDDSHLDHQQGHHQDMHHQDEDQKQRQHPEDLSSMGDEDRSDLMGYESRPEGSSYDQAEVLSGFAGVMQASLDVGMDHV